MKLSESLKNRNYPFFVAWGTGSGQEAFFHDYTGEDVLQKELTELMDYLPDVRDYVKNIIPGRGYFSIYRQKGYYFLTSHYSARDRIGRDGYISLSLFFPEDKELSQNAYMRVFKDLNAIFHAGSVGEEGMWRVNKTIDRLRLVDQMKKVLEKYPWQPKSHRVVTFDENSASEEGVFYFQNIQEMENFFANVGRKEMARYKTIYFLAEGEDGVQPQSKLKPVPSIEFAPEVEQKIEAPEAQKEEQPMEIVPNSRLQPVKKQSNEGASVSQTNSQTNDLLTQSRYKNADTTPHTKTEPQESRPKEERNSKPFYKDKKVWIGGVALAVVVVGAILAAVFMPLNITEKKNEPLSAIEREAQAKKLDSLLNLAKKEDWIRDDFHKRHRQRLTILDSLAKSAGDIELQNKIRSEKQTIEKDFEKKTIEKAKAFLSDVDFNQKTAESLLEAIKENSIAYDKKPQLEAFRRICYRVWQANEIIERDRIPNGSGENYNDKQAAIQDIVIGIRGALNSRDYDFLTKEQRYQLTEYANVLRAFKHKASINEIAAWVAAKEGKGQDRLGDVMSFLKNRKNK